MRCPDPVPTSPLQSCCRQDEIETLKDFNIKSLRTVNGYLKGLKFKGDDEDEDDKMTVDVDVANEGEDDPDDGLPTIQEDDVDDDDEDVPGAKSSNPAVVETEPGRPKSAALVLPMLPTGEEVGRRSRPTSAIRPGTASKRPGSASSYISAVEDGLIEPDIESDPLGKYLMDNFEITRKYGGHPCAP